MGLFRKEVYYDDLKYDSKLSGNNQLVTGSGIGLTWEEQLTNKTSLQLKASSRKPYDRYQAKISHNLNKQIFGQNTILQLVATHQKGKHGLDDDTRAAINLSFGSRSKKNISLSKSHQNSSVTARTDLESWTSKPAINESSIIAKVDQKAQDQRLAIVTKTDLSSANANVNKNAEITVNSVTGIAINQFIENGVPINFTAQQVRLENGVLVIGLLELNAPASYFVAVEQANGQFTHVDFATYQGSTGLSYLVPKVNQDTPNPTGTPFSTGLPTTRSGFSDRRFSETTPFVSIGTPRQFFSLGGNLSFQATGLPSGLNINPNTGVITGTPPNVDGAFHVDFFVTVVATDSNGATASISFKIIIANSDLSGVNFTDTSGGSGGSGGSGDSNAWQVGANVGCTLNASEGLSLFININKEQGTCSVDSYDDGASIELAAGGAENVYDFIISDSDWLASETIEDSPSNSTTTFDTGSLTDDNGFPYLVEVTMGSVDAEGGMIVISVTVTKLTAA